MELNLKAGISATIETTVKENDSAINFASGTVDVYATPAMIALMENTCKSSVDLHLPSGYTTVGIEVNVKHLKATKIGKRVKCEAILSEIKDKRLIFKVTAFDEKGIIGEGIHTRYIVSTEEFLKRL